jgi:diguanylate cyclase (GGDEF)-like protein
VEDESETAFVISQLLDREGFAVSIAASPAEAISLAAQLAPQALLVDIRLGDESGLDLLEKLRADGEKIPIIVVSVVDQVNVKIEAVRRGCDAYFEKPIDWDVLLRKLRYLLDPPEPRTHRILTVEDDPEQSRFIAGILRDAGYEVEICADVASVDDAVSRLRPDLVLLDIHLPDGSGLDVARYLRQDDSFAAIPILFLSADSTDAAQIEAGAAGADGFLRKPISPELLLASVAGRLSRASHLQSLLEHDGLTGLLTRAGFIDRAAALIADKRRNADLHFSLVFLDVDHFKQVNDTYGHVAGDRVLSSLASFLRRNVRESDLVARYGGEEFALLLHAPESAARIVVADILREFAATQHQSDDGGTFTVTFTGGVAELTREMGIEDWKILADRALYEGKRHGRNQVIAASTMDEAILDGRVLDPLFELERRAGVPLVAEIREIFLSALPARIETIRRAVESGDSRTAEQAAHAFRSAAGNIGAVRLGALCAELELLTRARDIEHARTLVPAVVDESRRVAAALARLVQ